MNEVTRHEDTMPAPLTAIAIRAQVQLIQEVMKGVMQEGQHYGVVPGCGNKPSLLKPGAEKLSLTFRLRPVMGDGDIDVVDMGNGHREYRVRCHILNAGGMEMATGVGSASTMESKYRYRNASDYELTGEDIPEDAKERKDEYRRKGFGMKKIDGVWEWVKYKSDGKVENPDIADTYNTVLKMAKKRAYVDGILSATAASDLFTQDLEDIAENQEAKAEEKHEPRPTPQRKSVSTAPVIKEYTGHLAKKFAPKGKSKYHSYLLAEHDGVYLQTDNEDIMETLARHKTENNEITLKVEESVNGQYTNRLITEVIVNQPTEKAEYTPDPIEEEHAY